MPLLFAGFGWPGQGWSWRSAVYTLARELCLLFIEKGPGAEGICSMTGDGRREALSTLAWFQAKLLSNPADSKSNAGGLLQKFTSPGTLVCWKTSI